MSSPLISQTITPRDIDAFLSLVDELANVPVSEVDQGLRRLMERSCDMIGADDAFWIAASYQPGSTHPLATMFDGWLPIQIHSLHDNDRRRTLRELAMKRIMEGQIDPYTQTLISQAGNDRALLREDVIPAGQAKSHWLYEEFFSTGLLNDRMVGASSLTDQTETYLGFDRFHSNIPFSRRDRDLMRFICIGLKWFFTGLHRSYGLIDASEPLTAREREVLLQVLTDKGEKIIAAEMGISPKTLHHHITTLYRKFSVNSRAALMALWLNYRSDNSPV